MGLNLIGPPGEIPIQALRRLAKLRSSFVYDGMGYYSGGPNGKGCDDDDMNDLNCELACAAIVALPEIERLAETLREAREELFRCGESSSSAWEHGDRVSRATADDYADEIHAKLDAAITAFTAAKTE